jgi:hypothetical protein
MTYFSNPQYKMARQLTDNPELSEEVREDYWQLCRRYQGQVYDREAADRAQARLDASE